MKRSERNVWRALSKTFYELSLVCDEVAKSRSYESELMAKLDFSACTEQVPKLMNLLERKSH